MISEKEELAAEDNSLSQQEAPLESVLESQPQVASKENLPSDSKNNQKNSNSSVG